MKSVFVAFLLFPGLAAAEGMKINKGDWEVQGAFNLSHSSIHHNSLSIGLGAQHFVANRFSVGADLSFAKTSHRGAGGTLGLAGTYYLLRNGNYSPYVYLSPLRITKIESISGRLSSETRLGLKFFINDSVAFGPALAYEHVWSKNVWRKEDALSLLGLFSIHL